MSSAQEFLFFQNTALSHHDSFPDTDVFVTKIYGMWTTSTNRHFLGVKITPGLLPHIAYFYRESNDTFSVEVWSYPSPDDLFDCPVMSWDEYAWVLGCSVDELSPEPTTPEENSKCIDPKLLQSEEPEPEACPAQSDSNVDKAAKDVIATDPNDTQEGAPRREKGKERETSLLSRKREHSTSSDNAAGPSKRPRRRSVSPEPEGPIASLSTGPSRHTIRRRRKDVGYKRGDLDCRVCGMECVTKQVLERHSLTHANDPIVFVCAGKQGTDGGFSGKRCLESYVRVDSFKRHIFRTDGSRKRGCYKECTPMTTSEYIALCVEQGVEPKAK